jgi:hypothetical protein
MPPSFLPVRKKPLSANANPLTLFAAAPKQRERKETPFFPSKPESTNPHNPKKTKVTKNNKTQ